MPSRPSTLPIVVDSPTPRPGLGFGKYIDGIAAAILGGSPARYTVGLYGPWGSGKSSLLAGVEDALRQKSSAKDRPYIVTFDAWRYESAGSLIFPLLQSVKRVVEADRSRVGARADSLVTALSSLLQRLEVSFLGVGLKYEKKEQPNSESFLTPFDGLSEVSKTLGSERRIVVLVDDLDRCTPEGVVSVLEAIHVLTDIEGFVFVLALDYDYLIQAISQKYPDTDAHRFIEKIIQVPFHIPRARLEPGSLPDIVRTWESDLKNPWFDGVTEVSIDHVVYWALRSNPRQVKRLFNTYLLARYMEWENTSRAENASLLFNVLGFQVAWPSEYRMLHTGISAMHRDSGDTGTTATLKEVPAYLALLGEESGDDLDGDAGRIHRYVRELLPESLTLDLLMPILNLTESVVDIDKGTDEAPRSRLDDAFSQASPQLVDLYDDVHDFAFSLGSDVAQTPNVGFMGVIRQIDGLKGSPTFLSLNLRPKKDKLLLFLPLPVTEHIQEGFIRDVTNIGHHGHGGLEITLTPDDDERIDIAKEFIRQSYTRLGARA